VIGLSLLTLVPGEIGGSETYARSLVAALGESGTLEYRVFVSRLARDAGDGLPTEVLAAYRASTTTKGRLAAMTVAALHPRPLRERMDGLELVHYPLTVPVPPLDLPRVVTVHDVQHLDLPRMFSRPELAFRRLAYDRAARRATAVIVPSSFVQERVVARLGVPPERVHVIHHGVDHVRFAPCDEPRESFLLYPARAWPHKNHARLFEAFAELRRERPELRLVLTGGGHETLSLPTGAESRGLVGGDELAALYRRAACLVFPSLYEGFGAPPLEAMACGCPVAASRAGSMPEVCGDAAVLFDPEDPHAIAAGVLEALSRAPTLSRLGLERASGFTWEGAAGAHDLVYAEALGAT